MGGKGSGRKKKTPVSPVISQGGVSKTTARATTKLPPLGNKVDELHFVRIYDLKLIPRYLLEQIKPRNFDIDEFYAMGPQFETDPLHLIYVLADAKYTIKGFFWAHLNTVLKSIVFEVLSVDKEYWGRGQILEKVKAFLMPIKEKTGFGIRFITARPRAFQRIGCKTTGEIVMSC